MDRQTIETALKVGSLWAAMANGNYWQLRRNGETKSWKREPSRFSIPVKAGLRSCARLTETDSVSIIGTIGWRDASFVISKENPKNYRD